MKHVCLVLVMTMYQNKVLEGYVVSSIYFFYKNFSLETIIVLSIFCIVCISIFSKSFTMENKNDK